MFSDKEPIDAAFIALVAVLVIVGVLAISISLGLVFHLYRRGTICHSRQIVAHSVSGTMKRTPIPIIDQK